MTPCTKRNRIVAAIAVAMVVLSAGLLAIVLLSSSGQDRGDDHSSHAGWMALVPIYTSLIPIYIAVAVRRRKNKKTDG